jgi:hypothetical protein
VSRGEVETILDPVSLSQLEKIGDWLVLYFIVKNLDLLTVNQVKTLYNIRDLISFPVQKNSLMYWAILVR